MSNKLKRNEQLNEIGEQAKNLLDKGNSRHVVLRNADGSKIAEVSMTLAALVVAFVLFMPWSWFIIAAAAVYGMVKKIRVEVVRDILNDDDIQVDLDS
jgi:hypothetical protein